MSIIGYNLGNCATVGVATEDRELVADEFTAAAGEDRRTAGEARALLLVAVGGRAPESETVWQHAEDDCGAAAAGRLASQQ